MYNQTELEGRQFQLKGFAESLRMRRYSDIAVPKPLVLLNYMVNVATVKVERQGNLKHIFLLKYSSLFTKRTLKQC